MKKFTLFAGLMVFVGLGLANAQRVFINEIHYDNIGADSGEGIELAGPSGTDLSNWSLVLYNGNGGASYSVINLSGILSDQQGGFGTAFFSTVGIQNGSPDGLALLDASSAVIQFLSYEGSFTATNGPANGLISEDIGVAESSSTPVGISLQLGGTGSVYADFTWQLGQPNTYDAVNVNQVFGTDSGSAPIINEFVFNHSGTDTNEFVEVLGSA
ncbi:MAG: endonuclease, partial [Bacteroidota bacterium]